MASVTSANLEIIVLAAGSSSRLGQAKQLVNIDSVSLLRRQCMMALSQCHQVHCVLGFDHKVMKKEIVDLPVNVVVNKLWEKGLSSSITYGVNALNHKTKAVMLLLVDQWQLSSNDINNLIIQWQKNQPSIIVSTKERQNINSDFSTTETFGPPIIFPSQYFQKLLQLGTGQGAKSIVKQYKNNVKTVPLPHAFIDLDTPEQLLYCQNYFNEQ